MGHLAGARTKRTLNSIEVVSDDNTKVLRFVASESGPIKIEIRDSTDSEWSYKPLATLDKVDAEVVAVVLQGGAVSTYVSSATTKIDSMDTQSFNLPKPPDPEKGPLDGDCTPLDIERAKAENLREERRNIELSMERDHALDKHIGFRIDGCPACGRAIYPGHGDGSLPNQTTVKDDGTPTSYSDAASRRVGTPHEESVLSGRPYCNLCGYVDEGEPDREYHPEFYGSDSDFPF
ncbi:MAG TPA: hypothetical protein VFB99_20165 [Vicinamibacterales bacterium]|nr:hypothetical protein [Vicinamibacterales bacterium]